MLLYQYNDYIKKYFLKSEYLNNIQGDSIN